jgi:glycosyltransferase involved in cell wall biosynthesis
MQKAKVCFINSCRSWGGGEKWHLEMARRLAAENFEVIVAGFPGSELHQRVQKIGLAWHSMPIGNLTFLSPLRLWSFMKKFRVLQPDTVILNLPSDLKAAGLAAKLACVDRIVYRRGSAIPVRNTCLNRFLFGHVVTDIIANSQETKQTILAKNPQLFDEEKIHVIYNGIDLDAFDHRQVTPLYKKRKGEFVLGHAGRLSREKNQKFLIEVVQALKEQGVDCKLLIAGKGSQEKELKAYARAKGVERDLSFVGFVEDIKSFMVSIDLFLLSSLWEGFGYVLVEAMAAGKPVIAFDASSSPEIVENGKTGFLVPFGDLESFVLKAKLFARDAELRRKMGKAGRSRVEELFALERTTEKLIRFLSFPN